MPLQADLTMKRGDYTPLVFSQITNLPTNGLSAYSEIVFTAKRDITDTDAQAYIQHTLADGHVTITTAGSDTTPGTLTVTLNAADTASLPSYETTLQYDVQVVDTSQSPARPYTIVQGVLTVTADVTQSVS